MSNTPERLDRLLSRLGYASRNEVRLVIKDGLISVNGIPATSPAQKVLAADVLFDGEPLEFPDGLTLIYHKPLGAVCSHKESGRLIYDDFPEHWMLRKPTLSSVGRLDKETSGLLILTDDGVLNHHLTSPKHEISKTYRAVLDRPLNGNEAEIFASGTLMLESDDKPCLPAELTVHGDKEISLVLHEGRYHQVRRMFAAVDNHVNELTRTHIGALSLESTGLAPGGFEPITPETLLARIEGR